MGMSNNLISSWYIYVVIVSALVFAWKYYTRSDAGGKAWDKFKLKIPIIGKSIKMTAAARFTRTMSTLLRSGINVLEAIEITSRTLGNKYLNAACGFQKRNSQRCFAVAFDPWNYRIPANDLRNVAIGEESGTLDSILDRAADFFEEEADAATAKMTAAMEPLMIIIMAVVVGLIIAACAHQS
jgi:type IV pilus assembly protein PilC